MKCSCLRKGLLGMADRGPGLTTDHAGVCSILWAWTATVEERERPFVLAGLVERKSRVERPGGWESGPDWSREAALTL